MDFGEPYHRAGCCSRGGGGVGFGTAQNMGNFFNQFHLFLYMEIINLEYSVHFLFRMLYFDICHLHVFRRLFIRTCCFQPLVNR